MFLLLEVSERIFSLCVRYRFPRLFLLGGGVYVEGDCLRVVRHVQNQRLCGRFVVARSFDHFLQSSLPGRYHP